jgi:hypothetical protein
MRRRLSFFKVYGPVDPAAEERRILARMFTTPWQQFQPHEPDRQFVNDFFSGRSIDASLYNCVMVEPPRRTLRTRVHTVAFDDAEFNRAVEAIKLGGFSGNKMHKFWPAALPPVAAVDWSPPEIRPDCEFQREPAANPIRNSFV